MSSTSRISVVVVVYRMPRQAMNTLYSLSSAHQQRASESDYEVIVVENASDSCLEPSQVAALGSNFRYQRREETGVSPVPALNVGIAMASAATVGLMIDGARMVTPGLLQQVMAAYRAYPQSLVAAPGYDLGDEQQQHSGLAGYDETVEVAMLNGVDWKLDGYRLFEMSCFSPGNANGYLTPLMESGCLFAPRAALDQIGGADERFDSRGGGMVNLDLYRQLASMPALHLVVLPGEGSFHQFHGGVTSGGLAAREEVVGGFRLQYEAIRGEPFKAPRREPALIGRVGTAALPFLQRSVEKAQLRARRLAGGAMPLWEDQ